MNRSLDDESRAALVEYRVEKSDDAIKEARLLAENLHFDSAVTRLYYACFYVATALLVKNKIETGSHKGVKSMLSLKFVVPGKLDKKYVGIYTNLFNGRQLSDYEDFVYQNKESFDIYFEMASDFISEIKKLLK